MSISASDIIEAYATNVLNSLNMKSVKEWRASYGEGPYGYKGALFIDLIKNGRYMADVDFYIEPPGIFMRLCIRHSDSIPCDEYEAPKLDIGDPDFEEKFHKAMVSLLTQAKLLPRIG